jgi:dihydroneopterin aldolase
VFSSKACEIEAVRSASSTGSGKHPADRWRSIMEMAFRQPQAGGQLTRIADTLDYKRGEPSAWSAFVSESPRIRAGRNAGRTLCRDHPRASSTCEWLRLKLSKPGAVRGSRAVGVCIERGQRT